MFPCDQCSETFTRKSNLIRHQNEFHFNIPQKHYKQVHGSHIDCSSNLPQKTLNHINRSICQTACNNSIRNIRFIPDVNLLPEEFIMTMRPLLEDTLQQLRDEKLPLKLQCSLSITFKKGDVSDESYFSAKTQPILTFNIEETLDSLLSQIDQYTKRGSAWTISSVNFFQLNVSLYQCI